MPVVFDEITGTVEPPATTMPGGAQGEAAAVPEEPEPGGLVQQIRRIEQRMERLRAD